MKEFKIIVPERKRGVVDGFLSENKVKYWEAQMGDDAVMFMLIVDDNKSNTLLHELKVRGVGEIFGDIAVSTVNTYLSHSKKDNLLPSSGGAHIEEILAVLEESSVINSNFLSLVVLSSILAAFGLVDNNVVIIIGSMIVAPLMGPIALTSLGAITPGRKFLRKGLNAETLGIGMTVFVGYIVGFMVKIGAADGTQITREMTSRATLNSTVVIYSLVSGIAAGLIIAKGSNISIVGVAIAASLAPPAAAIGLFLAAQRLLMAFETSILLLMNILAINFACSLIFLIFRLPEKAGSSKRSSEMASRVNFLITVMVGLLFGAVSLVAVYFQEIEELFPK